MKKQLHKKHRSKPPIIPYGKKHVANKDDSKSPNDLYTAEKKLVDLLKHKFADD